MPGRDALDVRVDGDVAILVAAQEDEVADRALVQLVAHLVVQPDAGEGVAADERAAAVGVVERPRPQRVDRAEQLAPTRVPEREAEIPEQVLQAALPPRVVGVQDELGVGQVEGEIAAAVAQPAHSSSRASMRASAVMNSRSSRLVGDTSRSASSVVLCCV